MEMAVDTGLGYCEWSEALKGDVGRRNLMQPAVARMSFDDYCLSHR